MWGLTTDAEALDRIAKALRRYEDGRIGPIALIEQVREATWETMRDVGGYVEEEVEDGNYLSTETA